MSYQPRSHGKSRIDNASISAYLYSLPAVFIYALTPPLKQNRYLLPYDLLVSQFSGGIKNLTSAVVSCGRYGGQKSVSSHIIASFQNDGENYPPSDPPIPQISVVAAVQRDYDIRH